MTLTEFAGLVGANPKWVLNTLSALDLPRKKYSAALARQLAVTRAIHAGTGIPLRGAFAFAERGLRLHRSGGAPVTIQTEDADVALTLDLDRLLSSFNIRLSVLNTMSSPSRRGRPRVRQRDPLEAAADWGIDLTLIADNLRKTPTQRIRQLDGMVDFARRVRRVARTD